MPSNRLLRGLKPMHPGEHLREDVLPALGKSKAEIARLLGISRRVLHEVFSEKQPVTTNLAVRIGKLCGDGPDIWLRMQQVFDREMAESELKDVIGGIRTLHAVVEGKANQPKRTSLR